MAWSSIKLGDLISIKYGKDHKKLNDGNIPVFGSGGIMRYVDSKLYDGPSLLLPRKGTLNNVMFSDKPFWTVDTMFWSIIDEKKVNPKFLYYAMCKKDLSLLNVGTSVPSLTVPVLQDIDIPYPPLDKQLLIASILSSLDAKIENNNKINANLEAQAQALFKSWFVDFEPFQNGEFEDSELGRIPKGWKVGTLGELIEVKYGKDHKRLPDGDIPVYGSGGLMRKVDRCLYNGESVLIPRKGTLNNVMYVNEAFWTVDTMFYSIMKQPRIAIFVYQFLIRKDLASMNAGSAVPSMTSDILNKMEIVIPPQSILVVTGGCRYQFSKTRF